MTLEELKGMVPEENHKALDEFLAGLNPIADLSAENTAKFIEGNAILKAERDRHHNQGLEKWQKNNLDKLYSERYAKENPEETPEQKRLKEIEIKLAEADRRAAIAEQKSATLKTFTEKGLPADLMAVNFLGDEETAANSFAIMERFKANAEQAKATNLLKDNGRVPQKSTDPSSKYLSAEQINEMTADGNGAEFDRNYERVMESLRANQPT